MQKTMKMTTIYIEEVTSDDDKEEDPSRGTIIDESNILVESMNVNKETTKNDTRTLKLHHEKLQSCPFAIGGGATFSIVGRKGYIFGGCSRSGYPSAVLHCYDFDANEWTCNISCKGSKPTARFSHSAIVHQSCIYIFGGQGISANTECNQSLMGQFTSLNCMYCFNTQTFEWTQLSYSPSDTVDLPSPRNSHSCIYSKHYESLIIFGGANESIGPMNDTWFFCLEDKQHQWKKITPNSDEGDIHPLPREMHASCIDDVRRCMYVTGGRNAEGNVCQDLWELNLESNQWNRINTIPSPRCAHTANLVSIECKQFIVIYGGWDGAGVIYNDFVLFDTEKYKWITKVFSESSFSNFICKFGHCSDIINNESKVILIGGANSVEDLSDLDAVQIVFNS